MNKFERSMFLSIFLIGAILIFVGFIRPTNISNEIQVIVLTILILLTFSNFFLEHYFSKPNDSMTNSISLGVLCLSIYSEIDRNFYVFWLLIGYFVAIFITSLFSVLLHTKKYSDLFWTNSLAVKLKNLSILFGNAKIMYTITLLALIFLIDNEMPSLTAVFIFVLVIVLINPKKRYFSKLFSKTSSSASGSLIYIKSNTSFTFKVFSDKKVEIGDNLSFRPSFDSKNIYKGKCINKYHSLDSTYIDFIKTDVDKRKSGVKEDKDRLYMEEKTGVKSSDSLFVGIVNQHTTIDKLIFEFVPHNIQLLEKGNIIFTLNNNNEVLYQIIEATLKKQDVDQDSSRSFVEVEAIQLGTWSSERLDFESYKWVPSQHSFVYSYIHQEQLDFNIEDYEKSNPDKKVLGKLLGTNLPVITDTSLGVTHHTAILGVTGTGKSVFARNYIKRLIQNDTKVIVIDFTNEYKDKFLSENVFEMMDTEKAEQSFEKIDELGKELSKFKNQQDSSIIESRKDDLKKLFSKKIELFMESSDKFVGILELPDISNNEGILEYTKHFMKRVLSYARSHPQSNRVCIAIEEAHTVVPEWNFAGIDDKVSKPLVNTMSQIALQGRKYNLGFLIIAQRTANVSKTILTQCNSLILFKQFDTTSKTFLANYIGDEYANLLPTLNFREAIAVGLSMKTNTPVLFEVPEIEE